MGSKRASTAVALTTAVGLLLGACGSSGSSNESTASADKTLTIWDMETPPNRVAAFKQLQDEYNATNPEFKISFQTQDWGQVYTKIAAAAKADKQPDVLFTIPDFTTYVRQLGIVQPVTGLFNEIDKQSGFTDAAKGPYKDQADYWAIPLYGQVYMLWYRQDLFKAAGIEQAPTTWTELLADAEKLTTGSQHGVAVAAGKNLATDQTIYSFMTTGNAADIFTKDGKVAFNNANTIATYEMYDKLLQYSPKDSGSYSWGEPQAALNNGSAAMQFGMGNFASFEKDSGHPATDLGCAPIPTRDQGGQSGSVYYSNGAMILSKDVARQKGAGDFLKWLLKTEHYGNLLNSEPGLFLPVTVDGATAPSWRSNEVISTYKKCTDVMLSQAKTGKLFGFVDGQYIKRIGDISSQNFLAQAVQQMYANGMSPKDSVESGQKQMESAIQ